MLEVLFTLFIVAVMATFTTGIAVVFAILMRPKPDAMMNHFGDVPNKPRGMW